jgi:hypothetical protein
MLKDVPALPANLSKRGFISGQPLWHVPDPEHEADAGKLRLDLQYSHGVQKFFQLSLPKPIEFCVYTHPPLPGHELLDAQRGLSVLAMCWSYILSARFLELQGKKAVYTQPSLMLIAVKGKARFRVATPNGPASFYPNEPPPDSAQATELLIELCGLYGLLEPEHQPKDQQCELSPATAGFLAALALPFSFYDGLQPQFPVPRLRRCSSENSTVEPVRIRQYTADLRYYMMLSMDPMSLGSALWSVFWQPDVETNLVSPWFSSILHVLKPVLEFRNLKQLATAFALRRPRIAGWWLGIFLLGNFTTLGRIPSYLESLFERWGFGTRAPPDTAVSAWTGSPQSFLDDVSAHPYSDTKEPVSRFDILRHRYNFRLQDEMCQTSAWRPCGYVARELVEPDLWPWLERGHVREYVHWVWWIRRGKCVFADMQLGFRRDTGRFIADVPDHVETIRGSRMEKAALAS